MVNFVLESIKKNVSLAEYTTFRIGGKAKYFFEVEKKEDLINVLKWAKKEKIPFFILGGGSNILVSDKGFDGLVIRMKNNNYKIKNTKIFAEAGVLLSKLVSESINNNLKGLEWAVGIPGTIGGAVVGNAGAYGHSISENVIRVRAIDAEGKVFNFKKKDCHFSYRESIFKKKKELVILDVELKLQRDKDSLAKEKMKEILNERIKKIPKFPSAGSFFKNYIVRGNETDYLFRKFPELKEKIKGGKLPVGYLIEQCGLKGKKIGDAQISNEHANFIINIGKASSSDVLKLAEICKNKVKEKFGISIEEEIRYIE